MGFLSSIGKALSSPIGTLATGVGGLLAGHSSGADGSDLRNQASQMSAEQMKAIKEGYDKALKKQTSTSTMNEKELADFLASRRNLIQNNLASGKYKSSVDPADVKSLEKNPLYKMFLNQQQSGLESSLSSRGLLHSGYGADKIVKQQGNLFKDALELEQRRKRGNLGDTLLEQKQQLLALDPEEAIKLRQSDTTAESGLLTHRGNKVGGIYGDRATALNERAKAKEKQFGKASGDLLGSLTGGLTDMLGMDKGGADVLGKTLPLLLM